MSKNTTKNAAKQPKNETKKAPKAPKAPATAPEAAVINNDENENVEVITVPQAADPKNLVNRKHSGLSPDGQVRLLDLARRTFVEETDPDLQFSQTVRKSVNRLVATGILCTLADHAANGDNTFALVLQSQAYPALSAAANDLGITLPELKALPANAEGQVTIPAKDVAISKETSEQIKKEKKIRESEKPELDPEKITSEEDLKKALEYMFVTSGGKRLPDLITSSIEFMKKFRLHEASLAENSDEAKARFEKYSAGDWLDDIFSYFRPPVFFSGIGRGMASVTAAEKSPIHAFVILRDAIRDKATGKPVMEDQDIAYCVKSIVRWVCNTNIESNKKSIENLDKEKNKKEIETCNRQIEYYTNILSYITNPASTEVDNLLENIGSHFTEDGSSLTSECQSANSIFNKVCKTYYGKPLATTDYKNLDVNVQQYAGCILNMFRDPGSQLVNYKFANITELQERSAEEKEALAKEARKAWQERKSAEKKEETKNE